METKYLNWLIGQGWTVHGPNSPCAYEDKWQYTTESPAGLQLYGFASTPDKALDNLEVQCQNWLTEVERNLNLTFVEN